MTRVDFKKENNLLTAYLIGEIDHHGALSVNGMIDNMILKTMPKVVVLNFSQVTFMDSSGIGLTLARLKFCQGIGASLYVCGMDKSVGRMLSLAGIKSI